MEAASCALFAIDRAVNSLAMAGAFAEGDWGLLYMLDGNEHQGFESFETTLAATLDDGSPVYASLL